MYGLLVFFIRIWLYTFKKSIGFQYLSFNEFIFYFILTNLLFSTLFFNYVVQFIFIIDLIRQTIIDKLIQLNELYFEFTLI